MRPSPDCSPAILVYQCTPYMNSCMPNINPTARGSPHQGGHQMLGIHYEHIILLCASDSGEYIHRSGEQHVSNNNKSDYSKIPQLNDSQTKIIRTLSKQKSEKLVHGRNTQRAKVRKDLQKWQLLVLDWERKEQLILYTIVAPRPTQPLIPTGPINPYQLCLGRQKQV